MYMSVWLENFYYFYYIFIALYCTFLFHRKYRWPLVNHLVVKEEGKSNKLVNNICLFTDTVNELETFNKKHTTLQDEALDWVKNMAAVPPALSHCWYQHVQV